MQGLGARSRFWVRLSWLEPLPTGDLRVQAAFMCTICRLPTTRRRCSPWLALLQARIVILGAPSAYRNPGWPSALGEITMPSSAEAEYSFTTFSLLPQMYLHGFSATQ